MSEGAPPPTPPASIPPPPSPPTPQTPGLEVLPASVIQESEQYQAQKEEEAQAVQQLVTEIATGEGQDPAAP